MTDDFQEVLAAAKAGDEHAFVALFRAVQPALLRYLGAIGGPLADDVAGDTWVTVVKGLHRFTGDESGWRAWVFTIAHSRLRDAQRRAARAPSTVVADDALLSLPDTVDVSAEVEELFSTESALRLLGSLSRDQAEAVYLRHVAGLDVKQTAQVLGKRPGAVRVATHRGLQRLTAVLDQACPERARGRRGTPEVTQNRSGTVVE